MTDEVNTQTAAQTTEVPATPAAEATGAQTVQTADLDSLLSEFDVKTAPAPEQKPTAPATAVVDNEARQELAELKFQMEIKPILERIRGDIPKDRFSDDEVLDLINGRARRDPRLQQAWLNRPSNPAAWGKIEKALSQEMSKKFAKLPDPEATEVREAVTHAVRGASQKAPAETPPNYGSMTDAEFAKAKASLGL